MKTRELKKSSTRILVCALSFLMTAQAVAGLGQNTTAYAQERTDTYVVITQDADLQNQIKTEQTVTAENGDALTVELSAKDAAQLSGNGKIECIEQDFIIESPTEDNVDMTKPIEEDWYLKAVHAENAAVENCVKVAVIDSGIDYTEDIVVKERKNFIADDPVTTPLFEDTCGHGTSVTSVIAGKGSDSGVKGVNGNIEIYSARVLNAKKQASVSSVVEAIYWAIEKDVNIINLSFGTQVYSEALKTAIDAATAKGILVVAAAGNSGNTNADYPAAFENVLSVGSINAAGKSSQFSAGGESVDLAAPGEAVSAQANFGEALVLSGTSLAAPHVTGIAACLWSKDLTKPANFIKVLLKLSANKTADIENAYGLIDYERALQIYDEVAAQFDQVTEENKTPAVQSDKQDAPSDAVQESEKELVLHEEEIIDGEAKTEETYQETTSAGSTDVQKEEVIPEMDINSKEFEIQALEKIDVAPNEVKVTDFADPVVTGSWGQIVHEKYTANSQMKVGAIYADKHTPLKGIGDNPEFHGFAWHDNTGGSLGTGDCNYMANYRFLIKVANAYGDGGGYLTVNRTDIKGLSTACYNRMVDGFEAIKAHDLDKVHGSSGDCKWCSDCNIWNRKSDKEQKAFVMGMAMHAATDVFAHSAFAKAANPDHPWARIQHPEADDVGYRSKRVQMAYAVEKNVVSRYNGNRGNYHTCNDFYNTASGAYDSPDFRITKMRSFAEAAGYTTESVLSKFQKLGY